MLEECRRRTEERELKEIVGKCRINAITRDGFCLYSLTPVNIEGDMGKH
jgi:hypothetical protein